MRVTIIQQPTVVTITSLLNVIRQIIRPISPIIPKTAQNKCKSKLNTIKKVFVKFFMFYFVLFNHRLNLLYNPEELISYS